MKVDLALIHHEDIRQVAGTQEQSNLPKPGRRAYKVLLLTIMFTTAIVLIFNNQINTDESETTTKRKHPGRA